jgi:hypothetical protein
MMVSPRGRGGLALWHRHCRGRAPGRGGGLRQRQQQASGARHQACAPQGWHRGLADAAGGGGGGGWGQWARGQWARYEAANLARPLLVRGTTGIVLYGIGDVAAQLASAPAGEEAAAGGLDGERTARCCSWRALVFTPMCHSFYLLMEHAVVASGLRGSLLKLAIDFVCFGPIVTVSFFGWCTALEKRSLSAGVSAARQQLWPALAVGWMYWLPLHTVTYVFMPLRHRLLWVNFCSMWYGTLLSIIQQGPE